MDADSDAPSLPETASPRKQAGRGTPRRGRAAAGHVAGVGGDDALLSLKEQCAAARAAERTAEDKARQLAAQLARTEEAAKRILTRTDASARGGVAQRLLDAERDLAAARAELAELRSQWARTKRVAGERKRQAADLQQRLDAALAAQRHLALQLGRLQAGSGRWSLGGTAGSAGSQPQAAAGQPAGGEPGAEAQADADARRFALQQEELAAGREQRARLQGTVQQQAAALERQGRELAALQARLAQREGGRETGQHPSAAGAGPEPLHAADAPLGVARPRGCTEDSEEGAAAGAPGGASLRLRYLESRSALERATQSNGKLLRELAGARREVAALRLQVRQQQQAAELQAVAALPAVDAWQPGPSAAASWDEAGSVPSAMPDSARRALPLGPPSPPAAATLQLRQQLAAAQHRAARLEIELDAARARLAVYEQQAHQPYAGGWEGAAAAAPLSHRSSVQPLQPRQVQSAATKQPSPHRWCSAAAQAPAWGEQASSMQPAVLELHLHAAELDDSPHASLQPLFFLTADVGGATAMTPVVTGTEVNTSLQFELGQGALAELACGGGGALVQLHRCAGNSGGVDYETLASAQVSLDSLLAAPAGPAAAAPRLCCPLLDRLGSQVGSLWYSLAAGGAPR